MLIKLQWYIIISKEAKELISEGHFASQTIHERNEMYFTVTVERMLPVVENKNSVGALEAQKVARHNTDNIDQTFLC